MVSVKSVVIINFFFQGICKILLANWGAKSDDKVFFAYYKIENWRETREKVTKNDSLVGDFHVLLVLVCDQEGHFQLQLPFSQHRMRLGCNKWSEKSPSIKVYQLNQCPFHSAARTNTQTSQVSKSSNKSESLCRVPITCMKSTEEVKKCCGKDNT